LWEVPLDETNKGHFCGTLSEDTLAEHFFTFSWAACAKHSGKILSDVALARHMFGSFFVDAVGLVLLNTRGINDGMQLRWEIYRQDW
jgi:hypothetical protein